MALDGYDPADADLSEGELTVVDEWVLSRLQSVKAEASEAWDDYAVHDALNAVLDFLTEDVSRFYVKATRERMWEEADSAEKRGAYATLATVLDETIRLLAPVTPYLAEEMYQILDGEATTVHQLAYPTVDDERRDPGLEADVAVLRAVEEAAANARQQGGRKLRWPVPRVLVETEHEDVASSVRGLSDLFADRVNARSVEVVEAFDELVELAEPEMGVIGPAFGGDAQEVMSAVAGTRREELAADDFTVTVDGEAYELTDEMVSFRAEPPENVASADFDVEVDGDRTGGTVYVDTSLTDEIESEGYARDVVRRIQEMRKRLDLDVDERIRTRIEVDDDRVAGFVDEHRDLIAEETRTAEFDADADDLTEEWDVEGVAVTIGIERLEAEQRAA
jgi:isoleucyl-tRNA synthetase